jgi:phage shock protein A
MGIFSRIGTLLKANINELISRAEDPEQILNQLILDMREQLMEAKKQVAVSIADEKRLKKQLDNELNLAREWEKKAMMAIRAGRDDLAKEALQRKSDHDRISQEFQGQWEGQKAAADQLRDALRRLNAKIEEARRKKNLLIARQKRAQAQKKIQETMAGLNDTSAFDTFNKMEEKISRMEAEAEASAELAEDMTGDNLASKFADLEADAGGDDALAALKAKMGVGGASRATLPSTAEETEDAYAEVPASRGSWDKDDF